MTNKIENNYYQATIDELQQVVHYYEAKGLWRAGLELPFFLFAFLRETQLAVQSLHNPSHKKRKNRAAR